MSSNDEQINFTAIAILRHKWYSFLREKERIFPIFAVRCEK